MKRSISLVLAILMVASLMVFGSVSASAETVTLIAADSDGWKAIDLDGMNGASFDDLPAGWKTGEGIEEWGAYATPMGNHDFGNTWPLFDNGTNGALPAFAAVKEFEVSDPDSIASLKMWINYDEDPVVYLNGTEVFSATGWAQETVDLTDYIDLLNEDTNVIAVAMKQGFGGCGLNLSLEAVAGEIELVDENGYANVKKADCTSYWEGLGDPNNMLNDNPNDCCGAGFNNQEWTLEFYGDVAVSEIYLQTKGKEEGGQANGNFAEANYTGDPTIFGFCSVYVGDTLVATKVPARSKDDGGFTLKLTNPITASTVKVVATEWLAESHLWANLNSFKVKAAETAEGAVQYFGTQGSNVENAVRFVATTTSLDYDAVGMLISTTDLDGAVKTWNVATNTVYTSLNSDGEPVPAPEGTSLFGVELYNIPANNTFDFTVYPYAKTADTMVIGTPAEDIVATVTETGSTIAGESTPEPEPVPEEVELTIGKFGSGWENWSDQTQLLITAKSGLEALDWTLTLVAGEESKTVTLKSSSQYDLGGGNYIYRFETCLGEGDNQFIPVNGTTYTVSVVVEDTANNVVYKSAAAEGFACGMDPIVPAEEVELTIGKFGSGWENWSNQTQLLITAKSGLENFDWTLTLVAGEESKTVTLKSSSQYDLGGGNYIYRFETCLGEGDNQFVPVNGTTYTVSVAVKDTVNNIIYKSAAVEGFACGMDPIVPAAGPQEITIGKYGTGWENWSNQTQLLITAKSGLEGFDWTLTIAAGEESKTVTLKSSSQYDLGGGKYIYRFETCLGEGANQFVPVNGTTYTITVSIADGEGNVLYYSAATEGYACGMDPIVPEA